MSRLPTVLAFLAALAAARADARIVVRGGLTHERSVSSGDTYYGEVVIENRADAVAVVKIYQTDYNFDASGSSFYEEVGSVPRSNGSWVSFTTPRISLDPLSHASINYTVTVPEQPDLEGTYWSLLMIESIPEGSPELTGSPAEPSLGIQTNVRYAIQLVTHVGAGGREDFNLASMRLEAQGAEQLGLLQVDLENTGERMFSAELRVELFDLSGRNAGTFLAEARRSYPGTSVRYSVDLSGVPRGGYKMLMMVRLGSGSVYASEYHLRP